MATTAVVGGNVTNVPWLVKKYTGTGGTTAQDITHGESYAPDFVWGVVTQAGTVSEVRCVRTSATVISVSTLVDAADTIEVYMMWLPQATGGQSTITTT